MTKYETRTLTIKVMDVETKVFSMEDHEVTIIGDLGIMVSIEDHAGWSVIHLPTMNWFDSARPASLPRRCSVRKLREWCELVQSDRVELWEQMRALGLQPTAAAKEACVEKRGELLAYCRTTEPE